MILTLFFIFLGFPYDQLAQRVSQLVEESGTMTLRIGELSPHLGLAGPGFKATDGLLEYMERKCLDCEVEKWEIEKKEREEKEAEKKAKEEAAKAE